MYVLLVVTIFPSQTESVLRLLRQQSFVAVSFAFSCCCKCQFFLIARVSPCLRGLVSPNIQSLNTTPRPSVQHVVPQERPENQNAWRGLLNGGPQRRSWCKLNPSSLAQNFRNGNLFPKFVVLDKRRLFCFEIVMSNSTDELRVPQFVDLT
jgi:hypothetical protein